MSTYTHRYIEVYREKVDGAVWSFNKLPDPQKHENEVYKIIMYNRPEDVAPYYKALAVCGDENGVTYRWEPVYSVESHWVPVKWYSFLPKNKVIDNEDPYYKPKYITAKDADGNEIFLKENLLWVNNGGHVRDDYISGSGLNGCSPLSKRGLPDDISEEVKNDIKSDYSYDETWATLAEWEAAYDAAILDFRLKVEKYYAKENKDEINRKLDIILKRLKDPDYTPKKMRKKATEDDYYDYEDTIEYLFEEEIWRLFNIRMEIDRTEFIIEEFSDWYSPEKARIIYYLA